MLATVMIGMRKLIPKKANQKRRLKTQILATVMMRKRKLIPKKAN